MATKAEVAALQERLQHSSDATARQDVPVEPGRQNS